MSEFVEVKTTELEGEALNWCVGKAQGLTVFVAEPQYGTPYRVMVHGKRVGSFIADQERFKPSTDWSQGGPLIEKYMIGFGVYSGAYFAVVGLNERSGAENGATHLIAACRAIVASVLGDIVSVPKELLA